METCYLEIFGHRVRIDNYRNNFLLLHGADREQLANIGQAIYAAKFSFIEEVIVTEAEICLQVRKSFSVDALQVLNKLSKEHAEHVRIYRLPVYFNEAEDWLAVKSATGLSRATYMDKLEQLTFSVAMFGFLPGFTYLSGLPKGMHVPRKATPAKQVEAGSIAIGGHYLGCYAISSPGGWQVIGRTPLKMLQTEALPPSPLRPGDLIRIQAIDQSTFEKFSQQSLYFNDYYG